MQLQNPYLQKNKILIGVKTLKPGTITQRSQIHSLYTPICHDLRSNHPSIRNHTCLSRLFRPLTDETQTGILRRKNPGVMSFNLIYGTFKVIYGNLKGYMYTGFRCETLWNKILLQKVGLIHNLFYRGKTTKKKHYFM